MLTPQVETNNQLKGITDKLSSTVDIGVIALLFYKSRLYIAAFFLISFFIAFLYLRYSQPVYESRAVIQINDANRAENVLQLNSFSENDNALSEAIEQIRSKVFLKRVVEKLDISVNYFSQGTFKSNELYKSSPFLVKINAKNKSFFGQKIYVELNEGLTGGVIKYGNQSLNFVINQWLKTNDFDINIFLNTEFDFEHIKSFKKENDVVYFSVSDADAVTAQLQGKVEIRVLSDLAKTIMVKVRDVNSAKATDVVNAIIDEYLNYDVERKSESSRNILFFIDSQLNSVYNELKNNESDLQKFKKEKNFSDKEGQLSSSEIMRYSTIEDQLMQVEMEEKIIAEIQNNISKNKSVDVYQLVSLISGTEYESVIKEITQNIQKLLSEKENMLYALTPNSESIKQINYQIENQKRLLIESLDAVRMKYKTRYKNLLERSSDFKSKFNQKPEDEVEFSRLNRVHSISEKYYTMLLEKKTEFSISKAGYVSKNIILERALGAGGQVSPSKQKSVLVAFLISFLFSAGLVFVRYILHDKIYSLNDITKYSSGNVTLLGVIPKYNNDIPVSQLVVDKNPKALISEAFRTVRTNLGFIDNSEGSKIISVTSTISGEGKTFVAINIAGVLAFTDKKVVIIDLDMRKPKIHKGFGVENKKGMSTILTGHETVDDCLMNTSMENLQFITAGPMPPNPAELIISQKLIKVINYLKTKFDYIIVDNAPIGLVTDGITTIQLADYPIYVFRVGYSKRMFTQILDRLKNESRVTKLSVVLNDVDLTRKVYSYNYGYGYGYGYGSGNGYYSDDETLNRKKRNRKKQD